MATREVLEILGDKGFTKRKRWFRGRETAVCKRGLYHTKRGKRYNAQEMSHEARLDPKGGRQ